ncbi:TIGR03982 family His-Xaa-Ser system protein [Alteromonas sp. LMIT006]|uniref:TIGR03982 family His-Xaa-Ser system protein n=1 Tax=Alteromonadaceae TaxID=72275 RepID=UPI0020CA7B42|nr:TIGR03982 family His-Xaa-Ser system protein [Alteromonas sp. LMIT006]UTP72758.1 TIGR03982 family His-Xaa-Ser system protein [Alteromonas sp. LMIT006]
MKNLNKIATVCLIIITGTYLWETFGLSIYTYQRFKTEYMELNLKCAHAMDSNWYIEQMDNEKIQMSSEIQLLDCHDYDKLRKKMLARGVSEHQLSYLGLVALEIHQKPAKDLAIHHKFRER